MIETIISNSKFIFLIVLRKQSFAVCAVALSSKTGSESKGNAFITTGSPPPPPDTLKVVSE